MEKCLGEGAPKAISMEKALGEGAPKGVSMETALGKGRAGSCVLYTKHKSEASQQASGRAGSCVSHTKHKREASKRAGSCVLYTKHKSPKGNFNGKSFREGRAGMAGRVVRGHGRQEGCQNNSGF